MARAGAVLVKLGRADVGRKLIDEAARDAAQLPTANRAGYYRGAGRPASSPLTTWSGRSRSSSRSRPRIRRGHRYRARIAAAIATTDTKRALALVDTVGGNAFYHEMARTAIAYQIGARPARRGDQDHRGHEARPGHRSGRPRRSAGWPWPWRRATGRGPIALIDRALAMMIDQRDWAGRSAWSGGEMAGAAHVAACARRIGYPDMESVDHAGDGGPARPTAATRPATGPG